MGSGSTLTAVEKGKIDAFKELGLSGREIAKRLDRSKTAVNNYLADPENYGKNRKGRTAEATTYREKRSILRLASNSTLSATKIRSKSGVSASIATVLRIIKASVNIQRKKMKKKPVLKSLHKELRMNFAREHVAWSNQWKWVVFSDEKKFNIDGSDGYNFYFHDLRKEELILSRHHSRTSGVMVWGAITYYGTIELEFLTATMNGNNYKCLLERAFPKLKNIFGPVPWIFQQDNAPIHTSRVARSWIESENVELLPWPPYSPDLNIIENVWAWLSRKVYEAGRQFEDKDALIDAIRDAWSKISLDYLKKLYDSIPNRLIELMSKNGGHTHY